MGGLTAQAGWLSRGHGRASQRVVFAGVFLSPSSLLGVGDLLKENALGAVAARESGLGVPRGGVEGWGGVTGQGRGCCCGQGPSTEVGVGSGVMT